MRSARHVARELLAQLGRVDRTAALEVDERHPALSWAQSGAMELTGESDGPPLLVPGGVASAADGALAALRALAGAGWDGPGDGAALLGERAALLGLHRRGRVSAGGSARLLPAADGWLAVNLPRPEDRASLAAWLEADPGDFRWAEIARRLREGPASRWLERAHLLGLAVAPVAPVPRAPGAPVRLARRGPKLEQGMRDRPWVLDLSSLWAGPLCVALLRASGARAVKLESLRRPDGARRGPAAFFDLMHAGKPSVALDFGSAEGRRALAALVERADIVVESSRPRALRQLGIEAETWVDARPGRIWVAISGYGRGPESADAVAFGDDAAAAAGLCAALAEPGEPPRFCADAIADPLAGLYAAVFALAAWQSGESQLLDVSLCAAAAAALGPPEGGTARRLRTPRDWCVVVGGERARVLPPRARRARGRARSLGADTNEVLAEC